MLSWDALDRCETAEEVADLLRRYGARGRRGGVSTCPLARATGWCVTARTRYRETEQERLTEAEREFVRRFDTGDYSDLVLHPMSW